MLPDFSARATVVVFYLGGQCTEAVLFPESFWSWNRLSGKDLDAGLYQVEIVEPLSTGC